MSDRGKIIQNCANITFLCPLCLSLSLTAHHQLSVTVGGGRADHVEGRGGEGQEDSAEGQRGAYRRLRLGVLARGREHHCKKKMK